MPVSAENVLFIKLGFGGCFEKECIDEGKIKLAYEEVPHHFCLENEWEQVSATIAEVYGTNKGATTSHRNQVKRFYTEPDTTMWITFHDCKLYYCHADSEVIFDEVTRTKTRQTLNGWKCVDSQDKTLFTQSLSGKLTKVQGFRGTICEVYEKEYLLNKINNTQHPVIKAVEDNLSDLKSSLVNLIKELSPQDFEIFVDLIFRSAGWSRVGSSGSTIKTLDIELVAPVTNERAIVQVKSESSFGLFEEYKERLKIPEYGKAFYVTHTPDQKLQEHIAHQNNAEIESEEAEQIQVWDENKLAELSINAGLIEWLLSTVG